MSVSPAQTFSNPSPVPGPSTVYVKPALDAASASATAVEIGSTVDEPGTLIEPETAGALPLSELPGDMLSVAWLAPVDAAGWLAGAVVAPPLLHAATNR